MTAAITIQEKHSGPSTLLHTLTLLFALLTLVSALLSMILGNRLFTLQTDYLSAKIETVTSEAASIQGMEAMLKTAKDKLENTQKGLSKEKAAAERLRRQLASAIKDLEKAKAKLVSANQTIAKLKSIIPDQSTPAAATLEPIVAPSTEAGLLPDPSPESVLQPSESSITLPATVQTPADKPAKTQPEASATQNTSAPTEKPEARVGTTTLPANDPLTSNNAPPVTEETITESPTAQPPRAEPAAE